MVSTLLSAQNNKAKKYFQKAYAFYAQGKLDDSKKWLLQSLEKDSSAIRTYYLLSDIYDQQRDFKAEEQVYFDILKKVDSNDLKAHYNLANLYAKNGHYKKAYLKYQFLNNWPLLPDRYKANVEKSFKDAEIAYNLYSNPVDIQLEKLKGDINTDENEYWPFLSPDGKVLFFTRTKATYIEKLKRYSLEENIHYVQLEDTSWISGDYLRLINTEENEGAPSISQDGKTLYFTACNRPNTAGDCNIYRSQLKNGSWTLPKMLPPPLNTPYKETQPSIAYDGRTLFFSSDRPNGKGGLDIYVSRMNNKGEWSVPQNLGSTVNTKRNEESPFIHADNQSLYFSSDGHAQLGGGDLFMAQLGSGKPAINLGYPINDFKKQIGIMVTADGEYGYFSASDSSMGNLDIYRFKMPNHLKPKPVIRKAIRVIDEKTKKPIEAAITINSLTKHQYILQANCDVKGWHTMALPYDSQYYLFASYPNYIPSNTLINDYKSDTIIISLKEVEIGNEFVLENIYFDFDSFAVKPASKPEIEYLIKYLNENKNLSIEIGGHTDNKGENDYNLELSKQRAQALKDKITEFQADLNTRILIKGYGSTQPIADNSSEIGRAKNRRTTIKIISINK